MPRNRWAWLSVSCCLGTLFMATVGVASDTSTPRRPNVLFIFSDDQAPKTLGCYPDSWSWVRTPNIDALAKRGVRFHASYLGSWCMPSRATLLTGRFPHGIESMSMAGVYPGSTYDPQQCPFIPAQMRRQGYHTAQIGKWHTGTDSGWGRDWDHQIVWNRPLHPQNAGAYYTTQILAFDGKEREVEGYPADHYTDWACEYIAARQREPAKPWFLWLCYGSVHGPATPAARHLGRYRDGAVELPADILPPRPGKPAYLDQMQAWRPGPDGYPLAGKGGEAFGEAKSGKRYDNWVRQVNECVPAIDEGVGRLLATLRDSGQLDNTIIVYAADQGFAMGEHGFRTKLAPYDANYRSPLIVSFPARFPENVVCDHPVNGADLSTTIAALTGTILPWKTHGHDLSELLANPRGDWPHPCFYEHMGNEYGEQVRETIRTGRTQANFQGVPLYVAVVQEQWKLIQYLDGKSGEELYDLKSDPEELRNEVDSPAHQVRRQQLRATLEAELVRTGAGFTRSLSAR